jgi:lipoate-protein ligase A
VCGLFLSLIIRGLCGVWMIAVKLIVLPYAVAPAAENMARDWLMLEGFAGPDAPRLRTYGWTEAAWTFGYSQAWEAARASVGEDAALIRRATGGGLVDHRGDWTFALVVPASEALSQARAAESYRVVHEALAVALRAGGVPVKLAGAPDEGAKGLSVCFTRAERNDLVRVDDGRKIAGAAQKRNKKGMLLQGSVDRAAAGEARDWEKVGAEFAAGLGAVFGMPVARWEGAAWTAEALAAETARYASREWNEQR